MQSKYIFALLFLFSFKNNTFSQVKILFDATKAESAANADWVLDADIYNVGFGNGFPTTGGTGTEANPQRFPTPAQSGITTTSTEDFWQGGLSAWGVECAKKGYQVETLPIGGKITYNDATNIQDLKNYKIFVVCEPNILLTIAEKNAILQYVQNGGNLIMIGNHDGSDRNFDGADSPVIWNDLMATNPFGMTFDKVKFSETTTNIPALTNNPVLNGSFGNVTKMQFSAGTTLTLDPSKNPTVKGIVYKTGVSIGNTDVMAAYCTYGTGKVFAIGDSSPSDDGTGDTGDTLYDGWVADASGNHRKLFMNVTEWMANSTVAQPLAVSISNVENVNCFGQKTGKATASVTGGTPPYTYLWSNAATTSTISNLAAGVYKVTVSGTATASVTITEGKLLTGNLVVLPMDCTILEGQMTANITSGTAPYSYKWSNGASVIFIKTTQPGTYSVTVSDAKNCTFTTSAFLAKNIKKPIPSIALQQTNCTTICATALVAGTVNGYTFDWGASGVVGVPNKACFSSSKKAKLTVTDKGNDCVKDTIVDIVAPTLLVLKQDKVVNASNGQKNGSASILVSGGVAPYKYEWVDGTTAKVVGTTKDLTGVPAGSYYCKVSDASGFCNELLLFTITNTVATQDIDNQYSINIFPNPSNDVFYIDLKNEQEALLTMYDTNGRIVLEQKITSFLPISVKNLTKGFFILKIKTKEAILFSKLNVE